MGNAAAQANRTASAAAKKMLAPELVQALEENANDLNYWNGLWQGVEDRRSEFFDLQLLEEGVMKLLEHKYHSPELEWRVTGVAIARTFFPYELARKKLIRADFVSAVLILTMETTSDTVSQQKVDELQIFAAKLFCEMADYQDFEPDLCSGSVLNFLCIVLNQLEEAEQLVTLTFKKLSRRTENLIILMEGSVGDILESYFKLSFAQLEKETEADVAADQSKAFANCAFTLGQFLKFGFEMQLDYDIVLSLMQAAVYHDAGRQGELDTMLAYWVSEKLMAECVRLFYWHCRNSTRGIVDIIEEAAPDRQLGTGIQILVSYWRQHCIPSFEMLRDFDKLPAAQKQQLIKKEDGESEQAQRKEVVCNMNILFWILIPDSQLRWLMKRNSLERQDLIFELLYIEPPPMVKLEIKDNPSASSSASADTGGGGEPTTAIAAAATRVVTVVDHLALFNTSLCDRTLRTAKFVLDSSECEPLARRLAERLLQMFVYLVDKHAELSAVVKPKLESGTTGASSSSRGGQQQQDPSALGEGAAAAGSQQQPGGAAASARSASAASSRASGSARDPLQPGGPLASKEKKGPKRINLDKYARFPITVCDQLLESISLAAFRRDVCASFAQQDLFAKLCYFQDVIIEANFNPGALRAKTGLGSIGRSLLASTRLMTLLASHPGHRLPWCVASESVGGENNHYPPPEDFDRTVDKLADYRTRLKQLASQDQATDSAGGGGSTSSKPAKARQLTPAQVREEAFGNNLDTILTLTRSAILQKDTLFGAFTGEIIEKFLGILHWWRENSSLRYAEEKELIATGGEQSNEDGTTGLNVYDVDHVLADFFGKRNLMAAEDPTEADDMLEKMQRVSVQTLQNRFIDGKHVPAPTVQDSFRFTSVFESLLILQLLSRLVLEPRWKRIFLFEPRYHAIIPNSLHGTNFVRLLLCAVATATWPEAREAAATLANLCWMGDMRCERLFCWLKFDSPTNVGVDSSGVLNPLTIGQPRPLELGRGMYRRSWGTEFVEGSAIILHPTTVSPTKIPAALTSASPGSTFTNSNGSFGTLLQANLKTAHLANRHWTLHCWFYWDPVDMLRDAGPPQGADDGPEEAGGAATTAQGGSNPGGATTTTTAGNYLLTMVLLQTHPKQHQTLIKFAIAKESTGLQTSSSFFGFGSSRAGNQQPEQQYQLKIVLKDVRGGEQVVDVQPKLTQGWHRFALVSSTPDAYANAYNGCTIYIDDWTQKLSPQTFLRNDFYLLGNDTAGQEPFGGLADFRIYARTLKEAELELLLHPPLFGSKTEKSIAVDSRGKQPQPELDPPKGVPTDVPAENYFPDQIVRMLRDCGSVKILASRLNVADTAAECLRVLGTLATLQEARSEIFGICGPKILELSESPLPMIKRQAARVLHNLR
ncbi:unnamed protein product [Amoebophrya sp. A120]|nr:unnamed protein product [Amoebophrya sp. A120]|eukprot:GSA120T00021357001.1